MQVLSYRGWLLVITVVEASDRRQGLVWAHKQLWWPWLPDVFLIVFPGCAHTVEVGDGCQAAVCRGTTRGARHRHMHN